MRSKARAGLLILAVGLLVAGTATESLAQSRRPTTREPALTGNPRRDGGGSCVYDKEGEVVFAPDGKYCPDGTDHLSKSGNAHSSVVASYPPALQGELARLLGDHDHIAQEIARLRQAVEDRNREIALEAVDKLRAEATDHRAREEKFFGKLPPQGPCP